MAGIKYYNEATSKWELADAGGITDGTIKYKPSDLKTELNKIPILESSLNSKLNNFKTELEKSISGLAGVGRTNETVKKNADDIVNLDTRLGELKASISSLSCTDQYARDEIVDIKLNLEEYGILHFLKDSPIGCYDLFTSTDSIALPSTTALVNTVNTQVVFDGVKSLVFKPKKFDPFSKIDVRLQAQNTGTATIKNKVANTNKVVVGRTTKDLNVGDSLFINGKPRDIISLTPNFSDVSISDKTVTSGTDNTTVTFRHARPITLDNGWIIVLNTSSISSRPDTIDVSKDNGVTFKRLCSLPDTKDSYNFNDDMINVGNIIYVIRTVDLSRRVDLIGFDVTKVSDVVLTPSNCVEYKTLESATGGTTLFRSPKITRSDSKLYACWTGRLSQYNMVENIRFIEGTINSNGSVTWNSVESVSEYTNTDNLGHNPFQRLNIISINGDPFILFQFTGKQGTNDYVEIYMVGRELGGLDLPEVAQGWESKMIAPRANSTFDDLSLIYVPSYINGLIHGRMWASWRRGSEINVIYSDNMGRTWSDIERLQNGYTNIRCSLTCDAYNNVSIIVVYASGPRGIGLFSLVGTQWQFSTLPQIASGITYDSVNSEFNLNIKNKTPLIVYSIYNTGSGIVKMTGIYRVGEGYDLLLNNPVTVDSGDVLPILDYKVEVGLLPMQFDKIINHRYYFKLDGLVGDTVDLKITGKNTILDNVSYSIS